MDNFKFRVLFLKEAKEFLDGLDEKARNKISIIFGKHEVIMIKNCLRNYKMISGNFEVNTIKLTSDYLLFGIKQIAMIQLLFQLTE